AHVLPHQHAAAAQQRQPHHGLRGDHFDRIAAPRKIATDGSGGCMDRRQLLKAGLAWPFALASGAYARDPIYIGDMHFHLFFPPGPNSERLKPLASKMADGKATLVAWSLVGDLLWMRPTPRGLKQSGVPEAGETLAWFQRDLTRIKAYIAEQNLKIVRTPA